MDKVRPRSLREIVSRNLARMWWWERLALWWFVFRAVRWPMFMFRLRGETRWILHDWWVCQLADERGDAWMLAHDCILCMEWDRMERRRLREAANQSPAQES